MPYGLALTVTNADGCLASPVGCNSCFTFFQSKALDIFMKRRGWSGVYHAVCRLYNSVIGPERLIKPRCAADQVGNKPSCLELLWCLIGSKSTLFAFATFDR